MSIFLEKLMLLSIFEPLEDMHKIRRRLAFICAFFILQAVCGAQPYLPAKNYKADSTYRDISSEQLFSPSAAQDFYRIAHQTAGYMDVRKPSEQEAEQAISFLNAAAALDPRANNVLTDIINIASKYPQHDYSQLLLGAIGNYIDESSDVEVVRNAFRYLLERLNSREEKEALIIGQLKKFAGKNAAVESELTTLLGLLTAEKADVNDALAFFMQAYNTNKYNRLAFAKIADLAPQQIAPAMWLEHSKLMVNENPVDMQSALKFAQQADGFGLYDTAAEAYQYCADLYSYMQPSAPLPVQIYLPMAISSYNSITHRNKPLQIAQQLRQSGRFDLLVEAMAGKAAEKNGDTQQAAEILHNAEIAALKSPQDAKQGQPNQPNDYEKLAWFYCFALADANKALDWANKAYSKDPNSQMAAAILAYSLVLNGQNDWAKSISENYKQNQIARLALAKIQLSQGKQDAAIESLKAAIAMDPASLEAETAKRILAEQGGTYIPSVDSDVILAALQASLGEPLAPRFIPPEKIISVQLNIKGNKFSYGGNFGSSVSITNNSTAPLIISEDGLFTGRIRIDAAVTGGIDEKVPNVVAIITRPPTPLAPGHSLFIPVSLESGRLEEILLGHPQASLNIEFTIYIDPVTAADGATVNRLTLIPPVKAAITRPGIEVSPKYLQNRLNSLSRGQQGQKVKSVELFAGLLMEQQDLANGKITYKLASADWMPEMLTSALVHCLGDNDWIVRVHTMSEILPLSLNYDLTGAVSENLNDTQWPCRLIAEYVLAKGQQGGFNKVLDWTARHDPNKFVRDMAVALGGQEPPQENPEQPPAVKTAPPPATSGRITEPNSTSDK